MKRLDDESLPLELESKVVLASSTSYESGEFLRGRSEGREMERSVQVEETMVGGEEKREGCIG